MPAKCKAVAMAAGLRIQSIMTCRPDVAGVMQVVDTMAAYVAIGVLPVTAVLKTFSAHRLSPFRSFPWLSAQYLNHLVLASIKRLEELTTPKTVKLLFESQEARHPKETKVLTDSLAVALGSVGARVSGRYLKASINQLPDRQARKQRQRCTISNSVWQQASWRAVVVILLLDSCLGLEATPARACCSCLWRGVAAWSCLRS